MIERKCFCPPPWLPPKIEPTRPLEQTLEIGMASIAPVAKRGVTLAEARRARQAAPPVSDSVFRSVNRESRHVLRFQITPTNVGYANTLRRVMITEVETVAFRADMLPDGTTADVKVLANSTPMSNEMLAHRIGLLPVHVANPLEWKPEEYTFKLDITNTDSVPRDVVAADIQVFKNRGPEEDPLPVPSVEFFHPDPVTHDTALLAVLKGKVGTQEPETLRFTAKATLGSGRENARFMPTTSRCAYGYTLDDDPEHKKEIFARWLKNSKKLAMSELESNAEKKAELEREFNTMERQRCYKMDEKGEPNSFDFVVESMGVLDPVYIVRRAIDLIQTKLLKYASIDSGDLPPGLQVVPAEARGAMFDFIFDGEDHTLGNLLQTWMDETQMDRELITFVGFKVPHPLRDQMVLRVGVKEGKYTEARAAVALAAREAAQMFKGWAEMWAGATAAL